MRRARFRVTSKQMGREYCSERGTGMNGWPCSERFRLLQGEIREKAKLEDTK